MQWEAAAAMVLGYIGQHFKAVKNISTPVVQGIMLLCAVGLFALKNPPTQPITSWVMEAVMWGLAVIGTASAAAGLGLAPKTDSK